jgi:glycerate 2-kinase
LKAARPRWDRLRLRRAASDILWAGLNAADPARLVREHLKVRGARVFVAGHAHPLGKGRIVLLSVGKAAASMARAAEAILGHRLSEGLAVDTALSGGLERTRLLIAGHPVPDERGRDAAREVESLLGRLSKDDLLLVLVSGGASALLPSPAGKVSLGDKARITALLLRAGATIQELNTVRKHLSRLKGGGLARMAAPARILCLVLSDVVGDDLSTIASGPTAPDPTRYADALAVLALRDLKDAVPRVTHHLEVGAQGKLQETPKPGDPIFRRVQTTLIGSNRLSVEAAAGEARRRGLHALILTTCLEGEAREAARVLLAILRECAERGRPASPPVCLLAGGETTVTVIGDGQGGRNQELAVAAVDPLSSFPSHAVVASLATDGIDGRSDAAGGIVDQESARRAEALGLAPAMTFLRKNDSRSFLASLGDLIVTGPTGTNVVDLTLLLAGDPRR